jgi:hypothetical protein
MKIRLLLLILLLSTFSFAQDSIFEDEYFEKGLISDSVKFGGFLAPTMDLIFMNNTAALFLGGEGGFTIGKYIGLGGYGKKLVTSPSITKGQYKGSIIYMANSGAWLGLMLFPEKKINTAIVGSVGRGGIAPISEDDIFPDKDDYDNVTIFFGKLEIMYKIIPAVAVSLAGSYTYVKDINFDSHTSKDFSGPGITLSLKLGKFSNT